MKYVPRIRIKEMVRAADIRTGLALIKLLDTESGWASGRPTARNGDFVILSIVGKVTRELYPTPPVRPDRKANSSSAMGPSNSANTKTVLNVSSSFGLGVLPDFVALLGFVTSP